jgi:hypothetical protein
VRGRGLLTLWWDGKYIDASSTKILDLSYFRFRRKNIFPHFFNITSMVEKLISKNDLTPTPTSFSFEVSLKNQQKLRNHFGKVWEWGKTWNIVKLTIEVLIKSIIKECEKVLRLRISKFSSFIHYIVGYFNTFEPQF